ncbi:MAG: hypothetical protein CMF23_14430 [Ignavibacteriae bacterium]|nr:hypothetical protein [Ignavibacteriota bacterium]
MIFKPAIDKLYIYLNFFTIFILVVTLYFVLMGPINFFVVLIALFTFGLIVYLLMMYNSISYEISDNLIIAKQLFFQIKINIDDIEKITDKFTLFSTPAVWKFSMSHKTLTIKYRVNNKIKWLTISPQEENQFIQEILKIKSELEIERVKRPN